MRRIKKRSNAKKPVRMLREDAKLKSISRKPSEFGQITIEGEESFCATCLHCPDSPCVNLLTEEVHPDIGLETTHYPSQDVCVYEAISWDEEKSTPVIDEDLCVGCGACLGRCPVGAIRLNSSGKAELNNEPERVFTETREYSKKEFDNQIHRFRQFTEDASSEPDIKRTLQNFPQVIAGLDATPLDSKLAYGLLVRNLLLAIGFQAKAGVPGDTNSRADLVFSSEEIIGLVEIESGDAMLDAVRRLLANYAIAHNRYGIPKQDLEAFIVCAVFPNKRSDVYEVIENTRERLDLNIRVLPLALLTVLASCGYQSGNINFADGFELSRKKRQVAEDASQMLGGTFIEQSYYFGAVK